MVHLSWVPYSNHVCACCNWHVFSPYCVPPCCSCPSPCVVCPRVAASSTTAAAGGQPGTAPVKMDRYKTKLCLFHLQGRCCKGTRSSSSSRSCSRIHTGMCFCVCGALWPILQLVSMWLRRCTVALVWLSRDQLPLCSLVALGPILSLVATCNRRVTRMPHDALPKDAHTSTRITSACMMCRMMRCCRRRLPLALCFMLQAALATCTASPVQQHPACCFRPRLPVDE